ncbi:hypothetical protein KC887_02875 [Candidatus Kaiserbacteria bacterium]|nr:hypothetical protein [Candidatus Kaiserbacteria bacterium]
MCERCDYSHKALVDGRMCEGCAEALKSPTVHDVGAVDDAGDVYTFTQTNCKDGDFVRFTIDGAACAVVLFLAWPVQIAGPRQEELHFYNDAERLKVIVGNHPLFNKQDCLAYIAGRPQ